MSESFKLKNGSIFLSTEAPGGVYNSAQLKKIAELCSQDLAIVKATEDQRLALFVKEDQADEIAKELEAVGLGFRHYQSGLHQPVSCIGELCESHEQDALGSAMDISKELEDLSVEGPLKIGINGCGQCCTPCHTLDISVVGESNGYRISLGGKGSHIPEFASFMAEGVPAEKLPGLIRACMDQFLKLAQEGENLQDVLHRCGVAEFVKVLSPYSQDAHDIGDPLSDLDQTTTASDLDLEDISVQDDVSETPADEDFDLNALEDDQPSGDLESIDEGIMADDSESDLSEDLNDFDLSDDEESSDPLADSRETDQEDLTSLESDEALDDDPLLGLDESEAGDLSDAPGVDEIDDGLAAASSEDVEDLELSADDAQDLAGDVDLNADAGSLGDDLSPLEESEDLALEDSPDLSPHVEDSESLDEIPIEDEVASIDDDISLDGIDDDDASVLEESSAAEDLQDNEEEMISTPELEELSEDLEVDEDVSDAFDTETVPDDAVAAGLDEPEDITDEERELLMAEADDFNPPEINVEEDLEEISEEEAELLGGDDLDGVEVLSEEDESDFEARLSQSIEEEAQLIASSVKDENEDDREKAIGMLSSVPDEQVGESSEVDEEPSLEDMDDGDFEDLDAFDEELEEISDHDFHEEVDLDDFPDETFDEVETISDRDETSTHEAAANIAPISAAANPSTSASNTFSLAGVDIIANQRMHLSFHSGAFLDLDLSSLAPGEEKSFQVAGKTFQVQNGADGYTMEIDGVKIFYPRQGIPAAS